MIGGIAPEEGYQITFEYGALKGDVKWRGGVQARYALKTSEGLYRSIRFNLYPEREDLKVNGSLEVRLNETGARNLTLQPILVTQPKIVAPQCQASRWRLIT